MTNKLLYFQYINNAIFNEVTKTVTLIIADTFVDLTPVPVGINISNLLLQFVFIASKMKTQENRIKVYLQYYHCVKLCNGFFFARVMIIIVQYVRWAFTDIFFYGRWSGQK